MNNSNLIIGIIFSLMIGGIGGYVAGKNTGDMDVSVKTAQQITEMTAMMKADGGRMEKMGTLMIEGGKMLEERGTKYNDQEMVMKGKDLEVNGAKHQQDGMSMMDPKSMMGMTEGGKMSDMPGMTK